MRGGCGDLAVCGAQWVFCAPQTARSPQPPRKVAAGPAGGPKISSGFRALERKLEYVIGRKYKMKMFAC